MCVCPSTGGNQTTLERGFLGTWARSAWALDVFVQHELRESSGQAPKPAQAWTGTMSSPSVGPPLIKRQL